MLEHVKYLSFSVLKLGLLSKCSMAWDVRLVIDASIHQEP
jgi:hypothetical protein